jgi:hypothetical protein
MLLAMAITIICASLPTGAAMAEGNMGTRSTIDDTKPINQDAELPEVTVTYLKIHLHIESTA